MKYIINEQGHIKVQNCKRNWVELIIGKEFIRLKIKDINDFQVYSEKIILNGKEYKLSNSYDLAKMMKQHDNIEVNNQGGQQPSGKASGFGPDMRWFESSLPSQKGEK